MNTRKTTEAITLKTTKDYRDALYAAHSEIAALRADINGLVDALERSDAECQRLRDALTSLADQLQVAASLEAGFSPDQCASRAKKARTALQVTP